MTFIYLGIYFVCCIICSFILIKEFYNTNDFDIGQALSVGAYGLFWPVIIIILLACGIGKIGHFLAMRL